MEPMCHLIKDKGTRQVTLAGHSLGGLLAMMVASRMPDRVRAVLLLATPLEISAVCRPLRLLALPRVRSVVHYLNQVQIAVHALVSKPCSTQQWEWRAKAARWAWAAQRHTVLRLVNDLVTQDWAPLSHYIRESGVNVELALATQDRTVNTAKILRSPVAQTLSPSLLPGGHMLPLEDPSIVASAIINLVRRVARNGAES